MNPSGIVVAGVDVERLAVVVPAIGSVVEERAVAPAHVDRLG